MSLEEVKAELGQLYAAQERRVDLETLESLLPALDSIGALSLVGNNQQMLLNLAAPPLVEGAPLLIPVLSSAVGIGPAAFFLGAASFIGLDAALLASNAQIPFLGLSAGFYLGLLLVPLGVVTGGAGVALAGAKK